VSKIIEQPPKEISELAQRLAERLYIVHGCQSVPLLKNTIVDVLMEAKNAENSNLESFVALRRHKKRAYKGFDSSAV
jgi:chromosomal replication initiation ATPase DnaA